MTCRKGHSVTTDMHVRQCGICYREYQAKWHRNIRKEINIFLNEIRVERGCISCGYNENYAALQFDHITPRYKTKEAGRRYNGCTSMAAALRLVNDPNVQVMCANCHAIKTRENKDYMRLI